MNTFDSLEGFGVDTANFDRDVYNQAIADSDAILAQEDAVSASVKSELSIQEEKQRRYEENKLAKEAKLANAKALPNENEDDWAITETMKRAANSVLPHSLQMGVDKFGGTYNPENKIFNSDDMTNVWDKIKEDPYGDKVLYYMRQSNGTNEDGSPRYRYKVGTSDVSAYDRYKTQLAESDIQIVGEKRFNAAEDVENRIHGNEEFLKSRSFKRGTYDNIGFGDGYTELYDKDILGIADRVNDSDIARNLVMSKHSAKEQLKNYTPTKDYNYARAFGSGAIQLAGLVTKLIGPNELGQGLMDNADKFTGYSRTDTTKAGKLFRRGLRRSNPIDLIDAIVTGGPEVFLESLPEMGAMMGAVAVTGGAAAAAGMGAGAAALTGNAAAVTGMAILKTNDTLDMRRQANGGREATPAEVARTFLVESITTAMDYGSFKFITKGIGGLGIKMPGKSPISVSKLLSRADLGTRVDLLIGMASGVTKAAVTTGTAAAVEAAQETSTELLRMLNEQHGTDKYTGLSVADIIALPENQMRLRDSLSLGAVGGGAPGAVRSVTDMGKGVAADVKSKMADIEYEKQDKKGLNPKSDVSVITSNFTDILNQPSEFTDADKEGIRSMFKSLAERSSKEGIKANEIQEINKAILKGLKTDAAKQAFTAEEIKSIQEQEMARFKTNRDTIKRNIANDTADRMKTANAFDAKSEIEVKTETKPKIDTAAPLDTEGKTYEEARTEVEERHYARVVEEAKKELEAVKEDLKYFTEKNDQKGIDQANKDMEEQRKIIADEGRTLFAMSPESGVTVEPIESKSTVVDGKLNGNVKAVDSTHRNVENKKFEKLTDDSLVEKAFFGEVSREGMSHAEKKRLMKFEPKKNKAIKQKFIKQVKSSVDKVSKSPEGKMLNQMFPKNKEGGSIRLAAIALDFVLGDIESNKNRARNMGRDSSSSYASRQNIAQEIGRSLMESYDLQLTTPDSKSKVASTKAYAEMGNVGIALLEEAGVIKLMDGNEGISDVGYHTLVNEGGDVVQTAAKDSENVPLVKGRNAIELNTDENMNAVLGKFMDTIMPGNKRIPQHEKPTGDIRADDHVLSPEANDVIKDLQDKPLFINDDVMPLLEELALAVSKKPFDDVMKQPEFAWADTLFGISKDAGTIDIEKQSDSGKKISKRSNAIATLDAVMEYMTAEDSKKKELYYNIFSAVNERIHIDEIAFNYQSDNVFARHALSPVKEAYVTEGKEQNEAFILTLAEELGVDPIEIMYSGEVMPFADTQNKDAELTLANAIDTALESGFLGTKTYLKSVWQNAPAMKELFESGKSPLAVINMLKAVQDVRDAMLANNNGDWTKLKIKSKFAVGFDGNTSGFVNKLLNMLGGKNHDSILSKLKRVTVPISGKLEDGYIILANEVKALIEQKKTDAKKTKGSPEANSNVGELELILSYIQETDKTLRNLSKGPMMTNLYGQTAQSMKSLLGMNIASDIIGDAKRNKANHKKVRQLISDLGSKESDPANMKFENKKAIADKISAALGEMYANALANVNEDLNSETDMMYKAYSSLHTAAKSLNKPLTMRSPFAVTYRAMAKSGLIKADVKDLAHLESDEYNFSIEKKKIETLGETIMNGDKTSLELTQTAFNKNENSLKVMPLHAIDSAILLLAYKMSIQKFGFKNTPGSMSVHDAVYSTPEFILEYRKNYNLAAVEVAKAYDLRSEVAHIGTKLLTTLEANPETKDNAITKELAKTVNDLNNGLEDIKAKKLEALNQIQKAEGFSVFGTFKKVMPGIDEKPKPKKKVETKTEVKEEVKTETKEVFENPFGNDMPESYNSPSKTLSKLLKGIKSGLNTSKALSLVQELARGLSNDVTTKLHLDNIASWIESGPNLEIGKDVPFQYDAKNDAVIISQDVVDGKSQYNVNDIIRYVAHEIEHKASASYIEQQASLPTAKQSKSFRYIDNMFNKLKSVDLSLFDKFDSADSYGQTVRNRIEHALASPDGVAEFVAIYRTNPSVRDAVNQTLFRKSKSVITKFIQSVRDLINTALRKIDLRKMSADTLADAMNNIVILGQNSEAITGKKYNAIGSIKDMDDVLKSVPYRGQKPIYIIEQERYFNVLNDVVSSAIAKGLVMTKDLIIDNKWRKEFHAKHMSVKDGIYYKTANLLHEAVEPGTLLRNFLSYAGIVQDFDPAQFLKYETANSLAQQERNRIDSDMLVQAKTAFDSATKGMTEADIAELDSMINMSLIHELSDLDNEGKSILDDIIKVYKTGGNVESYIQLKIKMLNAKLTTGDLAIKDALILKHGVNQLAKDIASYYDTRELGNLAKSNIGDHHVVASLYGSKKYLPMMQMIALEQLSLKGKNGVKLLSELKDNSKGRDNAFNAIMASSSSTYNLSHQANIMDNGSNQMRFDNITGSKINYNENYEFKAVTQTKAKELTRHPDSKWQIIREGSIDGKVLAVIASIRDDYGFQPGLASAINLSTDGVDITGQLGRHLDRSANNILRIGTEGNYSYKIMLTNNMLSKLDINKHPVNSLFKANGHNAQIVESMSYIKHMVNNESLTINTVAKAKAFDKALKNGDKKPYFVNFVDGVAGLDLVDYKHIAREYTTATNVTNVLGMNRRVNLVHKSAKDRLVGYSKTPLFNPDNKTLHNIETLARDAVTMFASHVVMGNPVKVMMDAVSNLSILGVNGVSMPSMFKYGKEAVKYMPQMIALRNKLVQAKFDMYAARKNSSQYTKKKMLVAAYENEISKHPFGVALKNGFIQSLSTDMMMKDKEAMSDLQKKVYKVFDLIGSEPMVKKAIFKWADSFGYGVEDFVELIAGKVPSGSLKEYSKSLSQKMKKIKSKKDVAAYLAEIFAVPGKSEILKLGGMAALNVDVISKWILYKDALDKAKELEHASGKKLTAKEKVALAEKQQADAVALAVNSHVNYMTNLPQWVDMLKDTGIWMFPHFVIKIQKVLAHLLKNKVVGVTGSMVVGAAVGSLKGNILDSSFLTKSPAHFSVDENILFPALF